MMWQGQIKLKEAVLEGRTSSFLEKEQDLQTKIEELESRLQEITQSSESIGQSLNEVSSRICHIMQ